MISKVKFFFNWDNATLSDIAFFWVNIFNNGFEIFNSARLIGAGLATIALAGVGIGVGYIFGQFVYSLSGNSKEEAKLRQIAMLGFAVTEAIGLFALMIVFLKISCPDIVLCKINLYLPEDEFLVLKKGVVSFEKDFLAFCDTAPKVWDINYNKNFEGLSALEKKNIQVSFESFEKKVYSSVNKMEQHFSFYAQLIQKIEPQIFKEGDSQRIEDLKQIKETLEVLKEKSKSFKEDFFPKLLKSREALYKDIP